MGDYIYEKYTNKLNIVLQFGDEYAIIVNIIT